MLPAYPKADVRHLQKGIGTAMVCLTQPMLALMSQDHQWLKAA
jgi:hypothetical protein